VLRTISTGGLPLACCFCSRGAGSSKHGQLHALAPAGDAGARALVFHAVCAQYCSGNAEHADEAFDADEPWRSAPRAVRDEALRGRNELCFLCKRPGATAGCALKDCTRSYHAACALDDVHAAAADESGERGFRVVFDKSAYSIACRGAHEAALKCPMPSARVRKLLPPPLPPLVAPAAQGRRCGSEEEDARPRKAPRTAALPQRGRTASLAVEEEEDSEEVGHDAENGAPQRSFDEGTGTIRDKALKSLQRALQGSGAAAAVLKAAAALEEAVYAYEPPAGMQHPWHGINPYTQHVRSLETNLRTNNALRADLLAGRLAPAQLAEMTPDDMKTEEVRLRDAAAAARAAAAVTLGPADMAARQAECPLVLGKRAEVRDMREVAQAAAARHADDAPPVVARQPPPAPLPPRVPPAAADEEEEKWEGASAMPIFSHGGLLASVSHARALGRPVTAARYGDDEDDDDDDGVVVLDE
jgi:hypothetical protein